MGAAEDVYFGGNNPDPLDLAEAILRSVGLHNMTMDEAARMASLVMGYFEPERRVDASAILSAESRDVFYMLEDAGILAYETDGAGRCGRFTFRLERVLDLLLQDDAENG